MRRASCKPTHGCVITCETLYSCVSFLCVQAEALSFHSTTDTMGALARNSSLFSLVIDATFAPPQWKDRLPRMLANPFAPVQLTVIWQNDYISHALRMVLSNLRRNNTVKNVTFKGFDISLIDMRFASELLAVNAVIQEICFIESTWDLIKVRGRASR